MGDIGMGVCPCHKTPIDIVGTIIIGSPTVLAIGVGKARMGDLVMCSCGHPATIIIGNPTILVNGLAEARVGDMFAGCPTGTLTIGAPTVLG
jgi:uncharacterized Zn-binding protein involved in type VI secretion